MYNARDGSANGPKRYYNSNPYIQAWNDWKELRKYNPEVNKETGEMVLSDGGQPLTLCYCGHTKYCECADPDKETFIGAVEKGNIIIGDKDNGWKPTETGSLDNETKL